MSAYAIADPRRSPFPTNVRARPATGAFVTDLAETLRDRDCSGASVLDALIDDLVARVATAVAAQMKLTSHHAAPEWLDSRAAANYLGVHRDTVRKLAAERAIPAHQDGPGCKLFFRRTDLDEWRQNGARVVELASAFTDAG